MSGVAPTPSSVVDTVSSTESAASPPAISAKRFEACPPLTAPRSTTPARALASHASAALTPSASAGMSAKQHAALSASGTGAAAAARANAAGVSVRPIASIE